MPFQTVGQENGHDIELFYEDQGSGRPVVLIHGYPLNGRSWERQTDALLDAGFRTITYDRRGFGQSSQPSGGYDYDTFVADLHTLVESLDLRDAVLVGHSMGTGEVTRYLATHGTDRVSRGVLLSAIPPFFLQTDDNPLGLPAQAFDDTVAAAQTDRFAYLRGYFDNHYGTDTMRPPRVSPDLLDANYQVAVAASYRAVLGCIDSWRTDFRPDVDRLRELDVPMMLVHGTADKNTPIAATGDRLPALLPELEYHRIEDAPHGIPWTHAEVVNPLLLAFCKA